MNTCAASAFRRLFFFHRPGGPHAFHGHRRPTGPGRHRAVGRHRADRPRPAPAGLRLSSGHAAAQELPPGRRRPGPQGAGGDAPPVGQFRVRRGGPGPAGHRPARIGGDRGSAAGVPRIPQRRARGLVRGQGPGQLRENARPGRGGRGGPPGSPARRRDRRGDHHPVQKQTRRDQEIPPGRRGRGRSGLRGRPGRRPGAWLSAPVVTDDMAPDAAQTDRFVEFCRTMAPGTWLHIHCRAGHGRTTTFMVMYLLLFTRTAGPWTGSRPNRRPLAAPMCSARPRMAGNGTCMWPGPRFCASSRPTRRTIPAARP